MLNNANNMLKFKLCVKSC